MYSSQFSSSRYASLPLTVNTLHCTIDTRYTLHWLSKSSKRPRAKYTSVGVGPSTIVSCVRQANSRLGSAAHSASRQPIQSAAARAWRPSRSSRWLTAQQCRREAPQVPHSTAATHAALRFYRNVAYTRDGDVRVQGRSQEFNSGEGDFLSLSFIRFPWSFPDPVCPFRSLSLRREAALLSGRRCKLPPRWGGVGNRSRPGRKRMFGEFKRHENAAANIVLLLLSKIWKLKRFSVRIYFWGYFGDVLIRETHQVTALPTPTLNNMHRYSCAEQYKTFIKDKTDARGTQTRFLLLRPCSWYMTRWRHKNRYSEDITGILRMNFLCKSRLSKVTALQITHISRCDRKYY